MQIYYLNLARRPDRRLFMDEQFARLGLAATRIEAVAAADIPAETLESYAGGRLGFWLTPPELGCTLSHLKAYEAMIALGHDYAAVFEDDAVLSESLPRFLAAFEADPPVLDLLRIESLEYGLRLGPERTELAGFAICRPYSLAVGSAGYIVSLRAAEILLAHPATRNVQIDVMLFDPFGRTGRDIDRRQLVPALCVQAHHHEETTARVRKSDVRHNRADIEARLFWRRLPHVVSVILYRDVFIAARKAWLHYTRGVTKQFVRFQPH